MPAAFFDESLSRSSVRRHPAPPGAHQKEKLLDEEEPIRYLVDNKRNRLRGGTVTVTYCDVTGNEIENATTSYAWRIRNRRCDAVRGRDFSVDGMKQVEDAVIEELADKDTFSFSEYKRLLAEKIDQMT